MNLACRVQLEIFVTSLSPSHFLHYLMKGIKCPQKSFKKR